MHGSPRTQRALYSQSDTFLPLAPSTPRTSVGELSTPGVGLLTDSCPRGTRRGAAARLQAHGSPTSSRDGSSSTYMLKSSTSAMLGPLISRHSSGGGREQLDLTLANDLRLLAKRIVIEKSLGSTVIVLGCSNGDSFPMDKLDPLGLTNPLAYAPDVLSKPSSRMYSRPCSRTGSGANSVVTSSELTDQVSFVVLCC